MGSIVITGASSDIGLAITRRLSSLGKPMLLHCRSHEVRLSQFDASVVKADFSRREDIDRFISHLDDVEILVNAAALTVTGLLPMLEEDELEDMYRVNILAPTLLCKAVIPRMCIRRKGIIINISSATSSKVYRGQGPYGGTKAYLETFTKGLAAEYAQKGIRCNSIAPGSIDSGSLRKMIIETGNDTVKDVNATGVFGTPEDVAAAAAFLCSDDSSYINGAVIRVDGGYWLGI